MLAFQPVMNGVPIDTGLMWTVLFIGLYSDMSDPDVHLKEGHNLLIS